MKTSKHLFVTALTLATLTAGSIAQTLASNAPAAKGDSPAAAAPAAPVPITAADVQALKDALAAQQLQIQQLSEQLQRQLAWQQAQQSAVNAADKSDAASVSTPANPPQQIAVLGTPAAQPNNAAPAPTPKTASETASANVPAPPQDQQGNAQAGSSDERIRNLERQSKGIGPISFSGDIRLRGEPFFGGPTNESQDRARARVRARFNAIADLGSQFRAGVTLASGDINDPTSTNQTLTGFYTRKTVALDQAFVEYKPKQFKNLDLIGGKFRYPWYNTELTWDKDLNPEGVAETLAFKIDNPVLKRFAIIGFQLPFAEVAETAPTDQRITQQITYGGQLQASLQITPHVMLSAYSGFYLFHGADAIALALAKASSKNPQTPLSGVLPLTSGNPVQDSTYTTTATTVVTVGGTSYPTGVTNVTNAQFASKFKLFDNIARIDIDTGHPKAPIAFIGDYVQNMGACDNLPNIVSTPANTATATYKTTLNSPCFAHQRRGYWAEGRVGRLEQKGDFQVGYTHIYIEREAVLGNFNYSDIRQGTNVTQHRLDTFYQFDKNVQLGFTALIGRPLATTEPYLERLQFDSIFIF
jgi:hypothetical protein